MSIFTSDLEYPYIEINQGGNYEGAFDLVDDAGVGIRGVTDGWTGRLEVRTSIGGALVTAFGQAGPGTLTIDDFGHVVIKLAANFTQALAPTADSNGDNNRAYVGDVEIWRPAVSTLPDKPPTRFRVFVYPEVTTS